MSIPADSQLSGDTIAALLLHGRQRLEQSGSARLDTELLLAHVLGSSRTYLYAHPEQHLDLHLIAAFDMLLQRRLAREPIAYITGYREFWSLPLIVSEATLVPRPETERLVELALARLTDNSHPQLADLGTGSGAIAIALAMECPAADITATDSSAAALTIAARNAERHCPGRIRLRQGDWCQALGSDLFDMLVSNPPYIEENDPVFAGTELRHEPREALAAGADGLDALRRIVTMAGNHLRPGAWLLLEHGAGQAPAVQALLHAAGFRTVESHDDMAGQPRVTCGRWLP